MDVGGGRPFSLYVGRTVGPTYKSNDSRLQSYAAMLTHYSTEPLTTGPDYDPLLLLLALAGDVHPNPGPSASRTSLAKVLATCVHDARIGYIQDVLVFETWRIIVEPMAGSVPHVGHHHSHARLPYHLVPPTMSDKTFNILQWNANGIDNKQTELSIFLEAHNVKVAAIQESKLTAQSRSPNIQNYTLVRQDRRLGPGGGLLFFIHNSVSFTRKPLSTTSKNDPHI